MAIYAYGQRRWGYDQAERYQDSLFNAFDLLAAGQRTGRPVDAKPAYQKFAVGSHFVITRLGGGSLRIVRLLHQRMDLARHLR